MANYIILRASPDWASFDLEETRPFLRSHGMDENLIVEFARIWDATFRVGVREFRARLKALAMDVAAAVRGASVVGGVTFDPRQLTAGDRAVFQDDDDWLAPHLFEALDAMPRVDGCRWGSIRIGLDFDVTAPGAAILSLRPPSTIVYTNNYAVAGHALARSGRDAFLEHHHAAAAFAQPGFVVADSPAYLSCAVKHPCSTLAIRWAMAEPAFRRDPAAFVAPFLAGVAEARPSGPAAWTAAPMAALHGILRDL